LALDYTGRTHTCGDISAVDAGGTVTLCGWVRHVRDLGGIIFIRLADRYGESQVLVDPERAPEAARTAAACHLEYVVVLSGTVRRRPDDQVRPDQPTGEVEVLVDELEVLSPAKALPFPIADEAPVNEELRLRHRYLDLRRGPMAEMLRFRHRFMLAMRNWLAGAGFLEVETPVLTRSTPEGARDFLVPSRVYPGNFYALPQSPQMYKQLLMVAGVDRYFQIARCFRDEDQRADRQPEFTQLDLEMSFADEEDVFDVTEGVFAASFREGIGEELKLPWPRLTWRQAMSRYGRDKPDTRFGLLLEDVTDILGDTPAEVFRKIVEGGGRIFALRVPGGLSRKELDELEAVAKAEGVGGLASFKVGPGGELSGALAKFVDAGAAVELLTRTGAEQGDVVVACGGPFEKAAAALGSVRLKLAEMSNVKKEEGFHFLWVTDFPLFERDPATGAPVPSHHPFTSPRLEDVDKLEAAPFDVTSRAYDVVGQRPYPRRRAAAAGIQGVRLYRRRRRRAVRLLLARVGIRHAAPRRHRAGPRPLGHGNVRRRFHSRGYRVPQDAPGVVAHGRLAGAGVARTARRAGPETQKRASRG
jgi:aspartyl-tRNA synthetase